jgi:hypothetical protein
MKVLARTGSTGRRGLRFADRTGSVVVVMPDEPT